MTPLRYLTEHILMPVLQLIVGGAVMRCIVATLALLKLLFNVMLRQKVKNTFVQQSAALFADFCGCWNVILVGIGF